MEDIKKLPKIVKGMEITSFDDFECESCILGKMTQKISRKTPVRSNKPLQLVFCDIAGPIDPMSKEGYKYSITFVDDYSGLFQVFLLKNKSDAPKALKMFIAQMSPFGHIQRIRCDNAKEFVSVTFKNICWDNKTKIEYSSPYSPHQNGKAERSHRTVFETARCLLLESKLPQIMWPYAVKMAVHVRNRCINNKLGITPVEALTGRRPDFSKLELFGKKCFAYNHHAKKLEPRSLEGIFLGYNELSPALLVYFPSLRSVRSVRNVTFKHLPQYVTLPVAPEREESREERAAEETTELSSVPQEDSGNLEIEDHESEKRYPTRERRKPKHLEEYVQSFNEFVHHCYRLSDDAPIPRTYKEATESPEAPRWRQAMDEEMASLAENGTYDLVELPQGKKPVGTRWVYTVKPMQDGGEKFKARIVAKGFSQVKDVDFKETFAPTAKLTTLRTLIQLAAKNDLTVDQLDVKTAYLNADIDHEIFIEQPRGYEVKGENGSKLFGKLNKSLYGLRQSGRCWNKMIKEFFEAQNLTQSKVDPCLYIKHNGKSVIYVLIWVDDILIFSNDKSMSKALKGALNTKFKMSDLGKISWFLGINFINNDQYIEMNQTRYIEKILDKFNMNNCFVSKSPCDSTFRTVNDTDSKELDDDTLYREIVGSLIYLMVATRPDLSYIVSKLSQYMSCPKVCHLNAAKRVLRYLKGTKQLGLRYYKDTQEPITLVGFSDSDFGSGEDRKSISGFCFQLQLDSSLISWKSQKQRTIALSSCEAEYVAIAYAAQESKFLQMLLSEMLNVDKVEVKLGVDNQSALALAKNPICHQRSKHIDVKYHFIRDEVEKGNIKLEYVSSSENRADIFTKPITSQKLLMYSSIVG